MITVDTPILPRGITAVLVMPLILHLNIMNSLHGACIAVNTRLRFDIPAKKMIVSTYHLYDVVRASQVPPERYPMKLKIYLMC